MRRSVLVAVAWMALGCAQVAPTAPSTPAATPPVPSGRDTQGPATAPGTTAPSIGGQATVDGALLDVLPPDVDGSTLQVDAETAAGIAADPALAEDIEALGVGLYAGEADYAVVTVTRLRPGVVSDPWFRDWRDTFDAGVCAQAGGIDGHAEAVIGGRTTFIGTCVGGIRTYHVHLAGPDRIVSLQALGDARYGELIVAGLTE